MTVHPPRYLYPSAKVHSACCNIGPYCVIGPEVDTGREGCSLLSHVAIEGPTKIGDHNPFLSILFDRNGRPQDLTYAGEPTRLEIGDHNEIREFVTISRGTVKGGGLTRVGSHILIMAYTTSRMIASSATTSFLQNAATLGGPRHRRGVGSSRRAFVRYTILFASARTHLLAAGRLSPATFCRFPKHLPLAMHRLTA